MKETEHYTLRPDVPQLMVDDHLVQSKEKVLRRLGRVVKHEANPILSGDRTWDEGTAFPFRGGVYREDGTWRMWYQSWQPTALCYAESEDGVEWRKPELDICPAEGDRPSNMLLRFPFDNFSVIRDPGEPERPWKGAAWTDGPEGRGVYGFTSPDGLHWERLERALLPLAGDTTSLWHDPLKGTCVLFTRYGPGEGLAGPFGSRRVWRSDSANFRTWSPPRRIFDWSVGDYYLGQQHYGADGFVYADMYLGFLEVYRVPHACLDTELIASRDGWSWFRVCEGQRFLSTGPQDTFDGNWAFPAGSPPIEVGDELWFYYQGRPHPHGPFRPPQYKSDAKEGALRLAYTGLARMRRDGFASLEAAGEEGTVTTVPLSVPDEAELWINAITHPGPAWVKVAVLNEAGEEIDGFGLDGCVPLESDAVRRRVQWKERRFGMLAGRPIRLRFVLLNAGLFSYGVAEQTGGRS